MSQSLSIEVDPVAQRVTTPRSPAMERQLDELERLGRRGRAAAYMRALGGFAERAEEADLPVLRDLARAHIRALHHVGDGARPLSSPRAVAIVAASYLPILRDAAAMGRAARADHREALLASAAVRLYGLV